MDYEDMVKRLRVNAASSSWGGHAWHEAATAIETLMRERDEARGKLEAWKSAQSYQYIGKDGHPVMARDLEDQRDESREELQAARMQAISDGCQLQEAMQDQDALIAAAYEAAAQKAYDDAGRFDTPDRIRSLTPADARAKWDAMGAELARLRKWGNEQRDLHTAYMREANNMRAALADERAHSERLADIFRRVAANGIPGRAALARAATQALAAHAARKEARG